MAIPMLQPIPAKHLAQCEFCRGNLDVRDNGNFQHVSGWVKTRADGGGHAVSLPVRANRWAHPLCMQRAIAGTTDQQALF